MEEPTKSNPTSQLNFIVLEKVVTVPEDEPLIGEVGAPQSTAIRDERSFSYIVQLRRST